MTHTEIKNNYNVVKIVSSKELLTLSKTYIDNLDTIIVMMERKTKNTQPPAGFDNGSKNVYEKKQPAGFKDGSENVYQKQQPKWFKDGSENVYQKQQPEWFKKGDQEVFQKVIKLNNLKTK